MVVMDGSQLLYLHGGRAFVHDPSVVGANELALDDVACIAVDGVAIDFSVAIDDTVFAGEVFIDSMDMEGVLKRLFCTEFAAEVFRVGPEPQLVGVVGVVLDPIVEIVEGNAGARAERDLSAVVGEEVKPVVVVMLGDGEIAVEHHPVDEVGELAHAASDALGGFSLSDGEPFLISLAACGSSDEFPHGEGFARTNQEPINVLDSQGEIDGLVLLQLHIDVAQTATNKGIMSIDDGGQRVVGTLCGELCVMTEVLQITLEDFLLHGETIGEGAEFAE